MWLMDLCILSFHDTSFHQSHHITAVGWNRQNQSETATDTILLGTSKGLCYCEIYLHNVTE